MSVTIILDLKKAVAMQKVGRTISDLAEFGHYYRHPDTATIAYPEAVSKAIGTLPANTNLKIAIVGGGAAGIAATYELSQIGSGMSNGSIDVTIFEADPENFLFTGAKPRELTNRRAGRVSATRAEGKTVYEIGAMRFPEIAGLTWHYAERVFGGDASVETFPNPGTVPTEFIFGSRIDRYIGDTWHDMDSPTRKIRGVIADGLAGSQSTPSLYQIGNKNPSTVSQQLSDSQTSEEVLAQIHLDWKQFIAAYDGTTLEAAVRHIIITRQADLPPIPALTADERINYYVELFGRFGFGTGGFKSLFNISLVEMMRLILWNYSNEYTLPVKENVEFIEGIYSKAKAAPRFSISAKQQRVSDVYHQEPGVIEPRQAVVASYSGAVLQIDSFDYVILALPQDAAQSLVSRLGYSAAVVPAATIGDAGFQQQGVKNVRPALLLSTTPGTEVRNARPVTAIGTLHMVSSSKVFGSIARSAADGTEVPSFGGDKIRAVVSDCGLAASYVVPSTTFPENYYSFLTSYTWDDDSTRLQHALGRWPRNAENETTGTMFNFMINRATRLVRDIDGADKPWWFGQLLGKVDATDKVSYDWTTNSSAGGFKLDSTGDHYQSNFCVRYHTHALDAKLDSRFFLASCSYSHLGGWLEGAFMSAVNAVTGIVTAANKGDVSKLNDEARKLMTNLDPVILVPKPAETLHSKSSHLETV